MDLIEEVENRSELTIKITGKDHIRYLNPLQIVWISTHGVGALLHFIDGSELPVDIPLDQLMEVFEYHDDPLHRYYA